MAGANSTQHSSKTSLTQSQKLMNQNYMIQLMMQQQKKAAEGYNRHSVGPSNGDFALDPQKKPFEASNLSSRFDPFQPTSFANASGLNFGPNHPANPAWSKANRGIRQLSRGDFHGIIKEGEQPSNKQDSGKKAREKK